MFRLLKCECVHWAAVDDLAEQNEDWSSVRRVGEGTHLELSMLAMTDSI